MTETKLSTLRRSEQELTDFFENASVGLHWVGPDGTILRANRAELELLGYSREEYVGHQISEFHVDQPVIDDILARLTRGETLNKRPARLRCKDGSIRHVLISSNVFFENDRFVHTRCITIDVTDLKHAELALGESEERFRTLADAAPVLIWMSGKSLEGVYFNQTWLEFTGVAAKDQMGEGWLTLVHPAERARLLEIRERNFEARRSFQVEFRLRRFDGTYRWMLDTGTPRFDPSGEFVGYIGSCVDIHDRREAEGALRDSEARFRALTMNAPAAIFIKDLEGRYALANGLASRTLGRDDITGLTDHELMPARYADRLREHDLTVTRSGKALEKIEAVESEGVEREFLSVKFPLSDAQGNATGVCGVAVDITERKRAERILKESELRFRSMANVTPAFIWTAAPDGSVTWASGRWFEYTGYSRAEDPDVWPRALHPDDRDRCLGAWKKALEEGTDFELEVRFRRHDGEYLWFEIRATPIRDADGTIVEWYGSTMNVHDYKLAQQALRDADRRKDEFLAMLSHELRNPLAPLRNAVQVLERAKGDPERFEKMTAIMNRQLDQLVRLVDDLLDVSRITRGKIHLQIERVALRAVLEQVRETVGPVLEENEVSLHLTEPERPIYVDGDPDRLAQVFGNLIHNACKYSPKGSVIQLSVEREGDDAVVIVRDEGIGIPQDEIANIFEMFSQIDETGERATGGLGIGLSLVKELVELHGGSVQARSDGPGKGSEFVVRLPARNSAPPEAPARGSRKPAEAEPGAQRPRRMLVVDDNLDAAESLALLLKCYGHETRIAHDGESAIALASSYRPEVILLDIGLPKRNGYEVCRAIRETTWGKGIELIAMTGWGQEEDRRRSREAGFSAHLTKPASREELKKLFATRPR